MLNLYRTRPQICLLENSFNIMNAKPNFLICANFSDSVKFVGSCKDTFKTIVFVSIYANAKDMTSYHEF